MSDRVDLQVEGLDELNRKLRALGPDLATRALRAAVAAGAQEIKKDVVARVPVATGTLRRAVYTKFIREESGPERKTFFVGVRSGKRYQKKNLDAFYWRFLEFGTARLAARPFIRPAWDARAGAALNRIKAKLAERIEKFARGS